MEASKITITPEINKYQPLDKEAKMQLRIQLLIDYIQTRPYMLPIKNTELATPLQMLSSNIHRVITEAIKRGKITKHELGLKSYAYTVNNKVTTRKIEPSYVSKEVTTTPPPAPKISLDQLAKDFYWETTSDSLHEFIIWFKNKK